MRRAKSKQPESSNNFFLKNLDKNQSVIRMQTKFLKRQKTSNFDNMYDDSSKKYYNLRIQMVDYMNAANKDQENNLCKEE